MPDDDPELQPLLEMRARLLRKLADLDARIAKRQGIPVNDPAQLVPSSTGGGYHRRTRPLKWIIHCVLCDREEVVATRYPGGEPRVCDECYAGFTNSQKVRDEAKQAEKEREKAGKPPRRPARRVDDLPPT